MATRAPAQGRVFDLLAEIPDEAGRLQFASRHRLFSRSTVEQLDAAVSVLVRIDLKKAQKLAESAMTIANRLADAESQAYALRAKANSLWFLGENREASTLHRQAIQLFKLVDRPIEVGRTLSTSIQSLILLGEYDRAHSVAKEAQKIFADAGDILRLARLDINVGNIFHRQDRFCEALSHYRRAYSRLILDEDQEGIIASLHNIAVCLIMVNDYEGAQGTYEKIREFCVSRKVPLALAQAEYNIAYMHYLRGSYGRALDMLRNARKLAQRTGDNYHAALCDLDLAEIYLEINLHHDAIELAQQAFTQFDHLGIKYEAAKALCYLAVGLSQERKGFRALELFQRARAMFIKEKNHIWPSLIDIYEATMYFNEGRLMKARQCCLSALDFFRNSPLPSRAILCRLLLARIALKAGEIECALRECQNALQAIAEYETPILKYEAHLVMGKIEEAGDKLEEAKVHYRNAKEVLDKLRNGLQGQLLKISFLENKLEVYESLVHLCIAPGLPAEARTEAWNCIEEAKSRTLLESISREAGSATTDNAHSGGLTPGVLKLREQLNWYYHRIEVEEQAQTPARDERLFELRRLAAHYEKSFLRLLRDLPSNEAEAAGLGMPKAVPLETLREALGPNTTLVEYFRVHDTLLAAIVTLDGIKIIPVTPASRAAETVRMLQFQLSKFMLGPDYIGQFHEQLLESTRGRLCELYTQLIAPVRASLKGQHLIVVPHEFLHQVPFHALCDNDQYLVDSFAVSYAPSASVYMQCRQKETNKTGSSLILGISDSQTPEIHKELKSIASSLPEAKVFVGRDASEQTLREKAPQSRLIHIASHGQFRRDNPAFSGIRLVDTFLTLYDLYRLRMPVDQVTLSGCSTGINGIGAGDELIGLMRGFLFAGARSLLLTLWDINDKTTAQFMKAFYKRFFRYPNRALALREAMLELRQRYPHPYYWAPFVLVGDASQALSTAKLEGKHA